MSARRALALVAGAVAAMLSVPASAAAQGEVRANVSAGGGHTCAIKTSGALECWGLETSGSVSGPNGEGGTFVEVSAGGGHTCAIKTSGELECWGFETSGSVSGPNARGRHVRRGQRRRRPYVCDQDRAALLECWGLAIRRAA